MRASIIRFRPALTLSRVFFICLIRKVFSYRLALASRMFILGICVLVYGFILLYRLYFFGPLSYENFILYGAFNSIAVLFLVFLFAKILLIKSGGLLQFTMQLPLKNKDRTIALNICEVVIVTMGFTIIYSLDVIVDLWKTGTPVYLLVNGYLPAIITYILLSLIYNLSTRIFIAIRLSRFSHLGSLVIVVLSFLWFAFSVQALMQNLLDSTNLPPGQAVDLTPSDIFFFFNLFFWVFRTYGLLFSILTFIISLIILLPILFISIPSKYPDLYRFVKFPAPLTRLSLWPFIAVFIRRLEWWVAVAVSFLAVPLTEVIPMLAALPLMLLLSSGVQMFSVCRTIRLLPAYRLSATKEALCMFISQALCIFPFIWCIQLTLYLFSLIPGSHIIPYDPAELITFFIFGITIPTLIGILFVHNEDNPIQAFAGYFIISIIALITYLAIQFAGDFSSLVIFTESAIAILLAILAIRAVRKSERYA